MGGAIEEFGGYVDDRLGISQTVENIANDPLAIAVLNPTIALIAAPFVYAYESIFPDIDINIPSSPTYASDRIGNTITEGVFVSRCYGTCKIGGNKLRFNAATDTDLRIIVGHSYGPVSGVSRVEVNDLEWSTLTGSHTKTEYTGTRTQTVDARFSSNASAFRNIAYHAFTFAKNDQQIGYNPNVTVIMDGLLCAPLAGGADAFTRNPAVILYDWYLNVEGYSAGDLDLNAFKSLEALCDEVPSGSSLPRYRFDYNFDSSISINDAKKLIWSSFNGFSIMSQGKIKPVWDSAQMEDGTGALTAKTVSHAFDLDNIVKDSFSWKKLERPNVVRIHYKDAAKQYKTSSVEVMDEDDINLNGEILYEERAYYITDVEIARRRARFKFNKKRYPDYSCNFSALSGAGDIEVLDLVTITHVLPGWTTKQFLITSRSENAVGGMKFTAEAYYSGAYDDSQAGTQANFESALPNPHDTPSSVTSVTVAMVAVGNAFDFDAVRVSFTPPSGDPFYSHSEVLASNDDATYYHVGNTDGSGEFTFSELGSIYEPGDTCYVKMRSVSDTNVKEDIPGSADNSVSVTSTMRIGSFYAGTNDFWGGNAAIGNAATKIVMGNLDGTPKIALGASADAITFAGTQSGFFVDGDGYMRVGSSTHGLKFDPSSGVLDVPTKVRVGTGTYIDIDGANARVRSSNYVTGAMGAGVTLEPDLLEVGNIAARGEFRSNVFQKNTVSTVGGNLLVVGGDVLAEDLTASDADGFTRITEAGDTRITEAGDTRVTEGGYKDFHTGGSETFSVGDILRIKTGGNDEWLEVATVTSSSQYGVIRDKAGDYTSNSNPVWQKGTAIVNYGQSGDGGVHMTASETNGPYTSIFTHTGSPWSSLTTRLRIGNLNGYLGYTTDKYGIAIGETSKHLKYDPTDGLILKGPGITSGTLSSTNWDATNGMQIDLDNATITIRETSGLTVDSVGGVTINGGELELWNTGHTTQYIDLSGTGIEVLADGDVTINGGSLELWNTGHTTKYVDVSGAGVDVLEGGDITLASETGTADANRGLIKWPFASYVANFGSDYDQNRLAFWPDTEDTVSFGIGVYPGSATRRFSSIRAVASDISVECLSADSDDFAKFTLYESSSTFNFYLQSNKDTAGGTANNTIWGNSTATQTTLRLQADYKTATLVGIELYSDNTTFYTNHKLSAGDPGSGAVKGSGYGILYWSGSQVWLRGIDFSSNNVNIQLG